MSNWKKIIIGILVIVVAFILFPLILTASDDIIEDTQTDTFDNVSTIHAGANTTANVTLTQALHLDALGMINSLSSNVSPGDDSVLAGAWTLSSLRLRVDNLQAGVNRTLTISYQYGALDSYAGMEAMAYVVPTIIFVGLLSTGGFVMYSGARGARRARKRRR